MNKESDLYRRLQRHLDRMPIPFPATESGVELSLLKRLFSPREAEIALALSAVPEPVERIHRRLAVGLSPGELGEALEAMVRKGAINFGMIRVRGRRVPGYGKAPLVIGMFEFQVDHLEKGLVEDFHAYMDQGFREAVFTPRTRQLRTVPINVTVGDQGTIGRYDDIRDYIRRSRGPFGVMNCVCRQARELLGETCARPESHETCLTIGAAAAGMRRLGHARLVGKEEFLSILDRAERAGFVIQPQNSRSPGFICCCCGDCCEVLTNARKLPRPAEHFHTNYRAAVDGALCTGCGACEKRCPMQAVAVVEGTARVDDRRCIGCGVCAVTCKPAAIRLHPKGRHYVPPADADAMYRRIFVQRYGPLRTLAKAARLLTGARI
jgi:electron transport complex protein RnfB